MIRARLLGLCLLSSATIMMPPVRVGAAEGDLPVFTDRLVNRFADWGWAPHSYTNRSLVYSGLYSVSVSPTQEWSGLFIHCPDLDTGPYTNVSFWANGGDSGGQLLRVSVKLGTEAQEGYSLSPLSALQWEQYTIPLDWLNADNKTNFQGFLIQVRDHSPTGTFYLDEIGLGAKPPWAGPQVAGVSSPVFPAPGPLAAFDPALRRLEVWIIGGMGLIVLLLLWLVFVTKRSATFVVKAISLVSSRPLLGPGTTGSDALELNSASEWRQRALAAEALADRQAQILREKLLPELTELAKSSLVQGLAAQRNILLDTQRQAQQELAEMESRLAELRLPLGERIQVYEKRTTELERELATRSEEMRQLIHATLTLVRQRLQEEKKKETAEK